MPGGGAAAFRKAGGRPSMSKTGLSGVGSDSPPSSTPPSKPLQQPSPAPEGCPGSSRIASNSS
eukprot:4167448-Alexandrium_andersonii.AAC.1